MDRVGEELREALAALEAGQLDSLRPDTVARLEAWLNRDASAAVRVAALRPPPDPRLQVRAPGPSTVQWERMWTAVRAAATPLAARRRFGVLRFWRPMVAAAACLLAIGVWGYTQSAPDEPTIAWATQVEIQDLEVAPDALPMVFSAGEDRTIPVIWVLETGG